MVIRNLSELLKNRIFLNVATADNSGQPNAAPKFILKYETPHLYLIDYVMVKTIQNLRVNPRVSLSFMDINNLEGYRLNGTAELIESGEIFDTLSGEFQKKILRLSADRLIEGVRTGKKTEHYELEMPDKFIIIKAQLAEVTRIGSGGDLYRESGQAIT